MKRFWKAAKPAEAEGGFTVALDQRTLMTPARAVLLLPTRALADGIAAEWDAQGDTVNPQALPLTRAANATIDRVVPQHRAVAEGIAAYGETDLLCYRAPHPRALAERQADHWDPLLDWAAQALSARLMTGQGVMHLLQPQESVQALREAVLAEDAWTLTALHEFVTLSGSLLLGLAVRHGRLSAEQAWPLSRIEEDWQIEAWGEDAEAAQTTARARADFLQAERFLKLL